MDGTPIRLFLNLRRTSRRRLLPVDSNSAEWNSRWPLVGEIFRQRIFLQSLERSDHAGGVGLRAGHAGVRSGTGNEQWLHGLLPQRVVLACDDFINVEERSIFRGGSLSGPACVIIFVPRGLAVLPWYCAE